MARGFAYYFNRSDMDAWACAIMPDHVHLVVSRGSINIEQVVVQLKGDASQALQAEGIHPMSRWRDQDGRMPKCFARGCWRVYLEPCDVLRAIEYVENNPVKEGLPRQNWNFVRVCDLNSAPLSRRG